MEMKKEKFLTGKRWRKPSNILAVQVSSAKNPKNSWSEKSEGQRQHNQNEKNVQKIMFLHIFCISCLMLFGETFGSCCLRSSKLL